MCVSARRTFDLRAHQSICHSVPRVQDLTLSKPDLDKDHRRKQHLSDPKKTWFQIARAFLPKKYRILKKNFVRALDT